MKKTVILVLLVLLVIGGGSAYAQLQKSPVLENADLTEEQVAELTKLREEMAALQDQWLQKMVEFGLVSQERADWIREGRELAKNDEAQFGPGFGCHSFGGRGRFGGRMGMRFNR